MKRLMLALLGAIAVLTSLIPAAQASTTSAAKPAREALVVAGGRENLTVHLSRVSTTDSTAYWAGYMQACAVVYSTGGCNTHYWWVTDDFNFTTDFDTGQAWNNGTPGCAANHTNYTWCSYVGNGTTILQEGFNFGSDGWARMDITGNYFDIGGVIHHCRFRGPSWAHISGYGFDYASNVGDVCPYIGT